MLSFFFFSSRRRHTRWPRDWSSDVCSSDLAHGRARRHVRCALLLAFHLKIGAGERERRERQTEEEPDEFGYEAAEVSEVQWIGSVDPTLVGREIGRALRAEHAAVARIEPYACGAIADQNRIVIAVNVH